MLLPEGSSNTAVIEYVKPRLQIGIQSMIGYDSVIGMYPRDFYLNINKNPSEDLHGLGRDSILSSRKDKDKTNPRISKNTRIINSSRL